MDILIFFLGAWLLIAILCKIGIFAWFLFLRHRNR